MIVKAVKGIDLPISLKEDLAFGRSRIPRERIAAIEFLTKQYHDDLVESQKPPLP